MPAKGNVGLYFCVVYQKVELCKIVCEAKQKYLVDIFVKQSKINAFSAYS